jgi:spermidine synthase
MKKYVRLKEEIGKKKEMREYLDDDLEFCFCMNGEIIESGISSATLADGQELRQHIEFLKTKNYGTVLFLDNMAQTCDFSELEAPYHETMVHIPLIEHNDPRSILMLGGGDGAIAREVLKHEKVEQCVMVELDRNVVDLSKKHIPNCARPFLEDDPRLNIIYQDCIGYLKDNVIPETFDVVIMDLVDAYDNDYKLSRGALYRDEFYKSIDRALKPEGIVITHIDGLFGFVKNINRSLCSEFLKVFPNSKTLSVYVPIFFMEWLFCVGAKDKSFIWNRFDPDQIQRLEKLSDQTTFYDLNFHKTAFSENFLVRDILPP